MKRNFLKPKIETMILFFTLNINAQKREQLINKA
jgi:hypothetical protein